jgi:hypothetical protein
MLGRAVQRAGALTGHHPSFMNYYYVFLFRITILGKRTRKSAEGNEGLMDSIDGGRGDHETVACSSDV